MLHGFKFVDVYNRDVAYTGDITRYVSGYDFDESSATLPEFVASLECRYLQPSYHGSEIAMMPAYAKFAYSEWEDYNKLADMQEKDPNISCVKVACLEVLLTCGCEGTVKIYLDPDRNRCMNLFCEMNEFKAGQLPDKRTEWWNYDNDVLHDALYDIQSKIAKINKMHSRQCWMHAFDKDIHAWDFVAKKSGIAGYIKIENSDQTFWYYTNLCSAHPFAAAFWENRYDMALPVTAKNSDKVVSDLLWTPLPNNQNYYGGHLCLAETEQEAEQGAKELASENKNIYAGELQPLMQIDATYSFLLFGDTLFDNPFTGEPSE